MIQSWCLLNVLNCFGRYELDLLQETNKRVKRIINQQFASKPYFFRAGLKLLIECRHGEILLKLYSSVDCFVPNLREWQKDKYDEEISDFSCNHFYSVEEMRPFMTEFLRVSNTEIVVTTSPYAPDLDIIAPLESVSHVWAGQRLNINGYSNGTGASFDQIFRSSMILRCRELYLHCKTFGMQFHKYPDLFNLHQFHYCKLIKSEVLLDIIQQNARYPESRTTLVLYVSRLDDILYGIETLRNDFLASSKKCRVQVIVEIGLPPESCGQLEFLLENNRTKETLQLSWITRKEAKDNFNVSTYNDHALAIQRFPN